MGQRTASVQRDTLETQISVTINLDGTGQAEFDTGVPFLEHMLDQVAQGWPDETLFFQGFVLLRSMRRWRTLCRRSDASRLVSSRGSWSPRLASA